MVNTAFEQVIRLQLSRYTPEEARKKHIQIARKVLREHLAGQASRPAYSIEVDNHQASSENEVKPFGVIVYRFTRMREIANFVLQTAIELSPERSGRYKRSWFLINSDGVRASLTSIGQNDRSFILTNDQPYSRKIQVRGARLLGVPPGIVERVRQAALRKYRTIVDINIEFITLKGGYILRHDGFRVRHGIRKPRNDARAGTQITYPALAITSKF